MIKTIKTRLVSIFFCLLVFSIFEDLTAGETGPDISEKIIIEFESYLLSRGWFTESDKNILSAWTLSPVYRKIEIKIVFYEGGDNQYIFSVYSIENGEESHRGFLVNGRENLTSLQVRAQLIPYMAGLTDYTGKEDEPEQFFTGLNFGYYRLNDYNRQLPKTDSGMFYLDVKFKYDPTRNVDTPEITLPTAGFIDSKYGISFNPAGESEGYSVYEPHFYFEPNLYIDVIMFGKVKTTQDGDSRTRSLYGYFNTIEYHRPFLTREVRWHDDMYSEHLHIQYCFWEFAAFRHDIVRSNAGKDLMISYKIGLANGKNSSLTAINISEDEQDEKLSKAFTNMWYKNVGFKVKGRNYYYSMIVPFRLELTADRYYNSRFEFKYHFYHFHSIQDYKNLYDTFNRLTLRYGYYITENVTAGFGYEFSHLRGVQRDVVEKNHWNRLSFHVDAEF